MNRAEQTREGSELQTTIKNIDVLFNLNHKLEGDISSLQNDYQLLSKRLSISIDDSEIITNTVTDPNDYVLLQALSPGIQQLGHFNVSGTGIIGTALGINCTPSAWHSTVNSVEEMYGTTANGAITQKTKHLRITKGAVETGDGTWVYQNSAFGYATKYDQYDGSHWFSTATLGANGAALTWIDSAYIAGGQVRFNLGKISGYFSVNGETTDHLLYVNYNTGAEYIQANGKLGINCVPSAWHSTVTGVFEEYGLIGNISLTNLLDCWRLAKGATQTGSDPDTGWVFNNSAGVAHKIHLRAGSLYFAYGGTGTVGTAVTWVDNFTFDSNIATYTAKGLEPYINLVNTTHEDTEGGRESRIYGKGFFADGTPCTLGYHEFSHIGAGEPDYASQWKLYLKDTAGVDTNVLLCYASSTLGYVKIPGMAGVGGFVKNNAFGLLSGNNGIGTTDITGLFANPTATIGLTVGNGSATSAMRSDAAPPLSQAITPTWTGDHLWGTTKKIGFRDAAIFMNSIDDGYWDCTADAGFRFNSGYIGLHNTAPYCLLTVGGDVNNPSISINRSTIVWTANQLLAFGNVQGEASRYNLCSNTLGGLWIKSYSQSIASSYGVLLESYNVADLTTFASFYLQASKQNGATETLTAHGATAKIFSIANYTTELFTVMGGGKIYMNNLSDLTASGDYSRLLMQNSNTKEIGLVALAEMTGGHSYKSVVWDDDDNKFCVVTAV